MIAVTGATGFLGRHVIAELTRSEGVGNVRALVRRPDPSLRTRFPGVEIVPGDLLERERLAACVGGATAVVHLAAKNVDSDGSGFGINVEGTERLCEAAVAAGVERFLYVSSTGVYGHGAHRDADETTPVRPDTPFSASKAAAEAIVLRHHRAGRLDGTVLRHRFVYGDGDESVVPRLMRAARRYPFWIAGGRARLSLVSARDFARVAARFATARAGRTADGEEPVYHVTSGEAIPYRQVIETLCSVFDYSPPRISLPLWLVVAPLAARERLLGLDPEVVRGLSSLRVKMIALDNQFSNRKLLSRLGGFDFETFATGLERSIDYYRRYA